MGRGWLTSENALVKPVNRNDANGYYRTLGLSPNATRVEIKAAFRRLVKRLHPDLGGNEELYRFVVEIVNILLDPKAKRIYDSVSDAIYLGAMEREELARVGVILDEEETKNRLNAVVQKQHWACFTTSGFLPGNDTDAWIDFCRQVSTSVGYRGKIRVGVVESSQHWFGDPAIPWGTLATDYQTFVVFQRGVEPNRLHALCAMIDWQKYLLTHPSN
jgi:hypothetical protein